MRLSGLPATAKLQKRSERIPGRLQYSTKVTLSMLLVRDFVERNERSENTAWKKGLRWSETNLFSSSSEILARKTSEV